MRRRMRSPTVNCKLFCSVQKFILYTYAVRNDVRVTVEAALGITVRSFVARQIPDDQSFVTAS